MNEINIPRQDTQPPKRTPAQEFGADDVALKEVQVHIEDLRILLELIESIKENKVQIEDVTEYPDRIKPFVDRILASETKKEIEDVRVDIQNYIEFIKSLIEIYGHSPISLDKIDEIIEDLIAMDADNREAVNNY